MRTAETILNKKETGEPCAVINRKHGSEGGCGKRPEMDLAYILPYVTIRGGGELLLVRYCV